MIAQRINIPDYDWDVSIFYDVQPRDADYILNILWDMGCARWHLYKAEDMLRNGIPNQGLTYSDKRNRQTIIVVGHASDLFSLLNTLQHEVNHLETHICECFGIDMHSESAAYLSGDIKEIIARNAWLTARKIFLYLL